MKKQPDIFCILIDGNRTKKSKDVHSRLDAFDYLGKENIDFREVITSSTSTIMSFTSIIAGRFAYEMYPAFVDINAHKYNVDNYFRKLKNAGYNIHSLLVYGVGRNYFRKELNAFYTPRNHKFFQHSEMLKYFKYLINNKWSKSKPSFLFFHAGPFEESDKLVSNLLNFLKEKKLYEDSIFILCSDHGYINYGKFHYLGWLLHPKVHSLYVDEDTIRTNLVMHLPKSVSKIKHKVINSPVCVIDIFETVLDYAGVNRDLKIGDTTKKARSFKDLIEKQDPKIVKKWDERLIRTDTRYFLQNYNSASIRNKFYKLVIQYKKNTLYRLKNRKEIKIKQLLEKDKKEFRRFKEFYKRTNKGSYNYMVESVDELYKQSKLSKLKNNKLGIYHFGNNFLTEHLTKNLSRQNNQVKTVSLKEVKKNPNKFDKIICIINNSDFFHYISFIEYCKKRNVFLLILNLSLVEEKYNKIAFWKDIHNQVFVINERYGLLPKMVLMTVLSLIKVQSWFKLKHTKTNYYSKKTK